MRRVSKQRARCHPEYLDAGRGLCNRCWKRAKADGTLIDHPRQRPTLAEWLDDYRMLTGQGYRHRHIAERFGVTITAIQRRVRYARARGLLNVGRDGTPVPSPEETPR